jgi:hypothetical protein
LSETFHGCFLPAFQSTCFLTESCGVGWTRVVGRVGNNRSGGHEPESEPPMGGAMCVPRRPLFP